MTQQVIPKDLLQQVAKIAGTEDISALNAVLSDSIMPKQGVNPAQMTAFLMVAAEYKLNPITKEIYAFSGKGGGIQPIVSVDGWLKMINSHKSFDGMEFKDERDDNNNLISVTCKIYRKDRSHPVEMTEYMAECKGQSQPWKQWPARMLRHKATIQCARYAFGFSGISDPDEAERIQKREDDIVLQKEKTINNQQELYIQSLVDETGSNLSKMMAWISEDKKSKLSELTEEEFSTCVNFLEKKQPQMPKGEEISI